MHFFSGSFQTFILIYNSLNYPYIMFCCGFFLNLFTALCTFNVRFEYFYIWEIFAIISSNISILSLPSFQDSRYIDGLTSTPAPHFIPCWFCFYTAFLCLPGEFFYPAFQLTNSFSVCSYCAFSSFSEFFISNDCIFNTRYLISIFL